MPSRKRSIRISLRSAGAKSSECSRNLCDCVNVAQGIALNCEHRLLVRHALADHGRSKPRDLAFIFKRRTGLGRWLDEIGIRTHGSPLATIEAPIAPCSAPCREIERNDGASRPVEQSRQQAV